MESELDTDNLAERDTPLRLIREMRCSTNFPHGNFLTKFYFHENIFYKNYFFTFFTKIFFFSLNFSQNLFFKKYFREFFHRIFIIFSSIFHDLQNLTFLKFHKKSQKIVIFGLFSVLPAGRRGPRYLQYLI